MDEVSLEGVTVMKSDAHGRVRGAKLTAADLKGPTGEALLRKMREKPYEDGLYEVDGHHFAVFTGTNPPAPKE